MGVVPTETAWQAISEDIRCELGQGFWGVVGNAKQVKGRGNADGKSLTAPSR